MSTTKRQIARELRRAADLVEAGRYTSALSYIERAVPTIKRWWIGSKPMCPVHHVKDCRCAEEQR